MVTLEQAVGPYIWTTLFVLALSTISLTVNSETTQDRAATQKMLESNVKQVRVMLRMDIGGI